MQTLLSDNSPQSSSEIEAAVCIVSGGLDSICTAAYLAEEKGYELYMLTFIYGQRGKHEIQLAKWFARTLKAKDHRIVNIAFMKKLYCKTNALTDGKRRLPQSFDYSLVVPVRNAIFISVATAWAMSINAKMVAYGAHADDFHYPDCRPEFIRSITDALNLAEADGIRAGLRKKISIWSPAVDHIGKSELLRIGYKILGDKIFKTWSCYSDGIKVKSGHILHCGICESCINRKRAINKARIEDKTCYATNG